MNEVIVVILFNGSLGMLVVILVLVVMVIMLWCFGKSGGLLFFG